jgi:lipopolysaccharide transport system permease protein
MARIELPSAPVRIRPARGWAGINLREVWAYRELLFYLVWRDVQVRYKQTVIGVAWVVLQPLATAVIFSIIFGNFARMPSDHLPYAVFAMAGLTPWNFFAGALIRGSASLVANANLISKVYFPRLIVPAAGILSGLVDLAVVLVLLFVTMLFFRVAPGPAVLALPLILLITFGMGLGVSLWLSALNVQYRDVGYLTPVLAQMWMYATPVIYASSLIPEKWRWVYALNPMVGVIDGFRWAVLPGRPAPVTALAFSTAVMVILLVSGALFFRRMEDSFADVV